MKFIKRTFTLLLMIGLYSSATNTSQSTFDYEREQRLKIALTTQMCFLIQGICYGSMYTAYSNGCSQNVITKSIATCLCQWAVIAFFDLMYPSKTE